jgi:putative two-component system response regulator
VQDAPNGNATSNADAPILVVDDQASLLLLAERVLRRAGYTNVHSTTDPRQAIGLLSDLRPDLLLLDLHMPGVDGYEVMDIARSLVPADEFVPMIVLTADTTLETRRRALANGATDFLTKPFDATEVGLRVRNALMIRRLHAQVRQQNLALEQRVSERTWELEQARLETLDRLAIAAEFRDDTTGQHTTRVARLAAEIARRMGYHVEELPLFARAAALHDVGKIGVADQILLKSGPLAESELEAMRAHTLIGAGILSGSRFETLQLAADIAMTHHERWDGRGYPHALAGSRIPLAGRIVAVADVFDALIHDRPYKRAWTIQQAMEEITRQAGYQFDPAVVEVFNDAAQELIEIVRASREEPLVVQLHKA